MDQRRTSSLPGVRLTDRGCLKNCSRRYHFDKVDQRDEGTDFSAQSSMPHLQFNPLLHPVKHQQRIFRMLDGAREKKDESVERAQLKQNRVPLLQR